MAERRIQMTPWSMQAWLAGRKWKTRRLKTGDKCPYQPGDRLVFCEKWRIMSCSGHLFGVEYAADDSFEWHSTRNPKGIWTEGLLWRSGRFLPTALARAARPLVTSVRCEPLQDISDADCLCEGIEAERGLYRVDGTLFGTATAAYSHLWESIHGKGSWSRNPDVWVIEFEPAQEPRP